MPEKRVLDGQEKIKGLRIEMKDSLPPGTNLNSKVRCKLCGNEFLYKDAIVRELFDVTGDFELVHCKYFSECKGIITDFEVIQY